MRQHRVGRRAGAAAVGGLVLTIVGCQAEAPRPFFGDGPRPAATAVVGEGGDMIIRSINGRAVPGRNRFMASLASDSRRYEIPAGRTTLAVQYADRVPKTVSFDARAGQTYQLDSYLKPRLLNLPVQPDQWDVMVKEQPGGEVVAETRDARG